MGFSRQEYWSGLPGPLPGDLPNPGIQPRSPALQADSLPSEPPGKPKNIGVAFLSLVQGKFPTKKLNLDLLHCRQIPHQLTYQHSTNFWGSCLHACSVVSNSLRPHGLWPTRLLCPWHFPGKTTGVGCHVLLQGIFSTQGLNQHLLWLLHWQADSLPLSHLETYWGRWKWKRVKLLSHVQFFVTACTVAYQAPLSKGFPRQEYWGGCHFWDQPKYHHRLKAYLNGPYS